MKVRIHYHHTDCGGVVYYATYLHFLEEARTQCLEERGVSIQDLAEKGLVFVVSRQEIDYKAPAFYGDILEVVTEVGSVSYARVEFGYEIKNQKSQLICKAKTIVACVGTDLKPCVIPEEIRTKLAPEQNSV